MTDAEELVKVLLYVSALRHMRLTHSISSHTIRKIDSLIVVCEKATTKREDA